METQKAYSFDRESLIKIGKGTIIAASGAAALFLLDLAGGIQIDNPTLASHVALLVPAITNAVKEYIKGK